MIARSPFDTLSTQTGPVGARLKAFARVWVEGCVDQWAVPTVCQGHFWGFKRQPPLYAFQATKIPTSREKKEALLQYVKMLVLQQAVVPVPDLEKHLGFYSPVFLVPKKSGGWKPVLDLKRLNRYIRVEHFKMESLNTVILSVQPGDWMASIDLQDAYLHIPIHPQFQPFLQFRIGDLHLQFQCLPFGFSTAPRTFTKVLVAILAPLREKGIRVLHYLDDILVLSQHRQILVIHVQLVLDTLIKFGLANQLRQKSTYAHTGDNLSRGILQHSRKSSFTPGRKNPFIDRESEKGASEPFYGGIRLSKPARFPLFMHTYGEMGQMASTDFPGGLLITVEERSPRAEDIDYTYNEIQPLVVDKTIQPSASLSPWPQPMDCSDDRRKSVRMGGTLPRPVGTGQMAIQCDRGSIKHLGAKGGLVSNPVSGHLPQGKIHPSPDGQQSGTSLCSESRRNTQQVPSERSDTHSDMGREEFSQPMSLIYPRAREPVSRSAFKIFQPQQRVVSESEGLLLHMPTMGHSPNRPICLPAQCEDTAFLFKVPIPEISRGGCPNPAMELSDGIRIPTNSTDTEVSPTSNHRSDHSFSSDSILAQETVVHVANQDDLVQTASPSTHRQPSVSRQVLSPAPGDPRLEGLEVERKRLGKLGCLHNVIQTLLQARKASTNSTYYRIWRKFTELAETNHFDPLTPESRTYSSFYRVDWTWVWA